MKLHHIIGCLAGWALWIVFFAIDDAYSAWRGDVPKAALPVTDLVVSVMKIAAWPFAWSGYFLTGEKHLTIINNIPLNVVISLVLWGTLGVVVAAFIHRGRASRVRS
jgi:hypothetical protein